MEQRDLHVAAARDELLAEIAFGPLDDMVGAARVVSFDFYDTLFTRLTAAPADIPGFMGDVLARQSGRADATAFPRLRRAAENAARARPQPDGRPRGDVGLDDIYRELGGVSGWPEALVAAARKLEWAVEARVLVPRDNCIAAARRFHAAGRRLIVITDTYMGTDFLSEVLERHGIRSLFDRIYASSELGRRKDTGTLWPWLREQEGDDLVHIGDNLTSDVEMPRRHQVRAIAVANTANLSVARGYPVPAPSPQGWRAGIALGPAIARIGNDPFARPLPEPTGIPDIPTFGYVVLGPLMFGFLSWLHGMVQRERLGHLCFLARDGFFLRQVYEAVRARCPDGILPASTYLLVSRRSVMPAATAVTLDPELILRAPFTGPLGTLLRGRLGISSDDVLPGVDAATTVALPSQKSRIAALLRRHETAIRAACADTATGLRAFLAATGVADRTDLGVVDLGYSGTIQQCLQVVTGRGIKGLYFQAMPEADIVSRLGGRAYGFFSENVGNDRHLPVRKARLLLEALLAAPHGQVTGYTTGGTPIHDSQPDAGADYPLLAEMADGMKQYCLDLLDAFGPDVLSIAVPARDVQEPLLSVIRGKIAIPDRLRPALVMVERFGGEEKRIMGKELFG